MRAMILAAGRGERMRPLTDHTPKPLLPVAGKALIEYSIEKLAEAGFCELVINVAYRAAQIKAFCGDGQRWGVDIQYSDEGDLALETAGGIAKALPLLGEEPFLVINSDVLCDYPLASLRQRPLDLAHLVLIDNPPHHPLGDFGLSDQGLLLAQDDHKYTFSGIGLYHPALFADVPAEPLKLRPVLERAIGQGRISGEHYAGQWLDIGTPQRLEDINQILSACDA